MARSTVFVREATGLVRHMSLTDSILLTVLAQTFGFGIVYYTIVLFSFPGGDPLIGLLIGGLGVFPVLFCYSMQSTAMPRAGGDYVFISRAIHPAIAVGSAVSGLCWSMFYAGVFANWVTTVGISTALEAAGSTLNNPTLLAIAQASSQTSYTLLVGVIVLVVLGFIIARSNVLAFKLIDVLMVVGILGVVAWIVVLGATDQSTFIARFNAYAARFVNDTDYYHTLIRTATAAGYTPGAGFSWYSTIGLVPFAEFDFIFLTLVSSVGSEVKRPKNNFWLSISGGLILSIVMSIAAVWALIHAAGLDFINSISYVYANGLSYALPTPPYFTLFAGLVTDNLLVQALMAVGFICWVVCGPLSDFVPSSRMFLALSFDRVLPERLSRVSRYGTPYVGAIVMTVLGIVMLFIYTAFVTVFGLLSSILGFIAGEFLLACVAAILFPFRKATKSAFESAPATANARVFGFPVMSIMGILGALFLGWVAFEYAVNPAYGANNLPSLLSVLGVWLAGFVFYFVAQAYRKRQGLDIALAMSQIPPE